MNSEERSSLSPIRVHRLLEERLRKINTAPLKASELVVQQDIYAHLPEMEQRLAETGQAYLDADLDEFDYDLMDEPFAMLEFSRIENSRMLPFGLALYVYGFAYHIGGQIEQHISYAYFASEEAAVDQIVLLLKLLANGQLSVATSSRNGEPYAVELLLYKDSPQAAVGIATHASFPLLGFRKSDKLKVDERKNQFLSSRVKVPDDFFMYSRLDDGNYPLAGRQIKSGALRPISQIEWNVIENEEPWSGTGKAPDTGLWTHLYRQWEFWALTICLGAVYYGVYRMGWMPSWLVEQLWPLAVLSMVIVMLVLPPALRAKQSRIAETGQEDWFARGSSRLDKWLRLDRTPGIARLTALLTTLALLPLFAPVFVSRADGHLLGLSEVIQQHPGAAIILAGYIIAMVLDLWFYRRLRLLAGGILLLSYIGLIVLNESLYNTSASIGPYEWLGLFIIVGPIVAIPLHLKRASGAAHYSATQTEAADITIQPQPAEPDDDSDLDGRSGLQKDIIAWAVIGFALVMFLSTIQFVVPSVVADTFKSLPDWHYAYYWTSLSLGGMALAGLLLRYKWGDALLLLVFASDIVVQFLEDGYRREPFGGNILTDFILLPISFVAIIGFVIWKWRNINPDRATLRERLRWIVKPLRRLRR